MGPQDDDPDRVVSVPPFETQRLRRPPEEGGRYEGKCQCNGNNNGKSQIARIKKAAATATATATATAEGNG
jgi:hypothetical protein